MWRIGRRKQERQLTDVPPLLVDHGGSKKLSRKSGVIMGVIGVLSLGLLVYPFWPEIAFYTQKVTEVARNTPLIARADYGDKKDSPSLQHLDGRWLTIPRIGVDVPLVEGKDVGILDQKNGVWHQTGDMGKGNLVLAGHRFKYLPPNTSTLYHLNKMGVGDEVALWWEGKEVVYRIEQVFTVDRNAVEILNPTEREQLTIYTCEDINASQRLVVVAVPVE